MIRWDNEDSLPMTFGKAALTLAGMALYGLVVIHVVVRMANQ